MQSRERDLSSPESVLQFEEASRTQSVQPTAEYTRQYMRMFEQRFAEISFLRRESGTLHNSFEWGYRIYECVRDGDRKGLYQILYGEKSFRYGVLARDRLRSVKDLVICLVSGIIQFAMLDHVIDSELAFTAGDTCIQLVEETDDVDEVLMDAYTSMLKLCDLVENYRQKQYHPLVGQVKRYVEQHAHERITVSGMASALGVSREYLSRVFTAAQGRSPGEYIRLRKMESARRMLQYSGMTVSEVSKYLGYTSQSHFAEAFRAETGMTPGEYRAQMGQSMSQNGQ